MKSLKDVINELSMMQGKLYAVRATLIAHAAGAFLFTILTDLLIYRTETSVFSTGGLNILMSITFTISVWSAVLARDCNKMMDELRKEQKQLQEEENFIVWAQQHKEHARRDLQHDQMLN